MHTYAPLTAVTAVSRTANNTILDDNWSRPSGNTDLKAPLKASQRIGKLTK